MRSVNKLLLLNAFFNTVLTVSLCDKSTCRWGRKKNGQKLIVTAPTNKPIDKGSCLQPQHQQTDFSGCLPNALGSGPCSSSWSFTCSPTLRLHYFYPAPAVDHLGWLCFRPTYTFSATLGAVPIFPLACLWVLLLTCSPGAHGLLPLTSNDTPVLLSHSSFSL